jgi:two-component system, OmpR family, sensor histidine kinase CreC
MVKIRTRLCAALVLLVGVGFYQLVDWRLDDLRPRYLETMEESMVDMATLLSSLAANQVRDGVIQTEDFRSAFDTARKRTFSARIYELTKTKLKVRVYITDDKGIVIFDSDNGRDEGEDYSQWNDVFLTRRGVYGARTTHTNPDDPTTAVLCVGSPIKVNEEIVGTLTVCKPVDSVVHFLDVAKRKIIIAGLVSGIVVVLLGVIISLWITWPITKLTNYATLVRDGKRVAPPKLGGGEIKTLGVAFEEMRAALEGKRYVENYVQALTHQMKSPLSAIRGAAELLEEDMPAVQRHQFLTNLRAETERIQDLVDRMLQLSALENRNELRDVETFDVADLISEIIEGLKPALSGKRIDLSMDSAAPIVLQGERFLIRQAVSNLLQNAVDFSESGDKVSASFVKKEGYIEISIQDNGPGIPEYALDKVCDRFYSLPRPGTGRKSSGLGLAFVQEVAALHGGRVAIENRSEGGVKATLALSANPPQGST